MEFLTPVDLYTMMGNALDNAIEASRRLTGERQAIRVVVRQQYGSAFVQISNYYDRLGPVQNGIPETTKSDRAEHGRGIPSIRAILCGVLAVLIIAANGAAWYFQGYLDNMYTVYDVVGGSAETVSYEETIAHGNDVSMRILQEGSVLLKNENNVLPLAQGTDKVNLFGWRSSKMVFGGAGSGFVDDADAVSLQTALDEKGTAIITVSRMGGEGNDLPADMSTVGGERGKRYLELSSDEEAMVRLVTESFDKVILLVNSSHAMELGFAKTGLLEPGGYQVKLMSNAHDVIQTETINIPSTIVYQGGNQRSSDLTAAVNLFDDVTVDFLDGYTYLSRNDWEGTWPDASHAAASIPADKLSLVKNNYSDVYQLASDPNLSRYENAPITTDHQLTDDEIQQVKTALRETLAQDADALAELDAAEGVSSAEGGSWSALQEQYISLQNGKLVFGLMGRFDYDSPVWELLLSQMSLEEISDLVSMGGYRTAPVESIDKSVTMDIDGPAGMQPFLGFGIDIQAGVGYPTEVVVASTWNVELAEEMGQCVGQFANSQNVSGWYAPAMNMHRSPFAGRNFEYYSEDGVLSGSMGAAATRGARQQGIWVYLKHYALNDQELHRDQGLCTFANEQAIREIYLRPFELSVQEGEATGVMSAFNLLGYYWAGASHALCTDVLRNEWGFQGAVITDFYMNWGSTYMNARQGVLAGNDLYLNPFQGEAVTVDMLKSSN